MNAPSDEPPVGRAPAEDDDHLHTLVVRFAATVIALCAARIRVGVPASRQEVLMRAMREVRLRRDALTHGDDAAVSLLHYQLQELVHDLEIVSGLPIVGVQTDDQQA